MESQTKGGLGRLGANANPLKRSVIVIALCLIAVIATQFALHNMLDHLPPLPADQPEDIPTYEEVMSQARSSEAGVTVETKASGEEPAGEDQ